MAVDCVQADQSLRAEADGILWRQGLHALLREYGDVDVTGSYALHLMAWRDLDIYLVAPGIAVNTFFEVGGRIAELLHPVRMSFRDERLARTPGLPEGLYWGTYLAEGSRGWKIDLWAVSAEQHAALRAHNDAIAARLDDELRRRILAIKAACWARPGYRKEFTSQDIYRAVLEDGVEDLAEFEAYLRRQPRGR